MWLGRSTHVIGNLIHLCTKKLPKTSSHLFPHYYFIGRNLCCFRMHQVWIYMTLWFIQLGREYKSLIQMLKLQEF